MTDPLTVVWRSNGTWVIACLAGHPSRDDREVGTMSTPALAAHVVELHNASLESEEG